MPGTRLGHLKCRKEAGVDFMSKAQFGTLLARLDQIAKNLYAAGQLRGSDLIFGLDLY